MSKIKTALERFQAYCASKGIPEKSSLAHIHKIDQFEEHERKELRAAYEALQKENERLDFQFKQHWCSTRGLLQKYCAQNAAQAKRIEELLKTNNEQDLLIKSLMSTAGLLGSEAQVTEIESLRKQVEELRSHLTAVVEEINHLMNDSKGVAGLHLNGDIAPWASLLRGGEFDTWLSYLSDAAEYIQSKNGE